MTACPSVRTCVALALAATGLVVLAAGPGRADDSGQDPASFAYGKDQTNWYWKEQQTQNLAGQQLGLPSPQASDTLPVAVAGGQPDKLSALQLDLDFRGYQPGAAITSLVVTLAEGTAQNDKNHPPDLQQEFNQDGKAVQACMITASWKGGQAGAWSEQPGYDGSTCADGQYDKQASTWTFDLTSIAQQWGSGAENDGVMLVPVAAESGSGSGGVQDMSWQVNLKIPAQDDASTSGTNEYDETKSQFTLDFQFGAGEPTDQATPPPTVGGGSSVYTGTTGSGGGGISGPSSTTSTTTTTTRGSAGNGGRDQTLAAKAPPVGSVPKLPWYAWVLFPAVLIALGSVRAVIVEPAAGPRPDGAIAAIRARNQQVRGAGGEPAAAERVRPIPPVPPSLGQLARAGLARAAAWGSESLRRIRSR